MKARQIQESTVNQAPPCVREIWDYLLRECNHVDRKVSGRIIKRGQCVRTYEDIRQALHWHIGWRKTMYTKHQVEFSMKFLRSRGMIATQKTTRGLIITVVKYDYYQNPVNYKQTPKPPTKDTVSGQTPDTINNNVNNVNKETLGGKTPTNQMIGIFVSVFKEFREGTPKVDQGKDGKLCKSLYKQCCADNPKDPLGLWKDRLRELMEQHDISSIGGISAFWNSVIPKKHKTTKPKIIRDKDFL